MAVLGGVGLNGWRPADSSESGGARPRRPVDRRRQDDTERHPLPGSDADGSARLLWTTEGPGPVSCSAVGRWAFAPSLFATNRYIGSCVISSRSIRCTSFPVLAGQLLALNNRKRAWPVAARRAGSRPATNRQRSKSSVYDRLIARRIMRLASVLFLQCAEGEREESTSGGSLCVPSVVIPHGIELLALPRRCRREGAFRRQVSGWPHRPPWCCISGRLNEKKGLDLLIDTMSEGRRDAARCEVGDLRRGAPSRVPAGTWRGGSPHRRPKPTSC